jgi:hypothetical protein
LRYEGAITITEREWMIVFNIDGVSHITTVLPLNVLRRCGSRVITPGLKENAFSRLRREDNLRTTSSEEKGQTPKRPSAKLQIENFTGTLGSAEASPKCKMMIWCVRVQE